MQSPMYQSPGLTAYVVGPQFLIVPIEPTVKRGGAAGTGFGCANTGRIGKNIVFKKRKRSIILEIFFIIFIYLLGFKLRFYLNYLY